MTARRIRLEYEELARIVRDLAHMGDDIATQAQHILNQVSVLRNGLWTGEGANAFFDEVELTLMPLLRHLSENVQDTADTTHRCQQRLTDIDEQWASTLQQHAGIGGNVSGLWQGRTSTRQASILSRANTLELGSLAAQLGTREAGLPVNPVSALRSRGITISSMLGTTITNNANATDALLRLPILPTNPTPEQRLAANLHFQAACQTVLSNPQDAVGYFELGSIFEQHGFPHQAIQSYRAFLTFDLSDPYSASLRTDVIERLQTLTHS